MGGYIIRNIEKMEVNNDGYIIRNMDKTAQIWVALHVKQSCRAAKVLQWEHHNMHINAAENGTCHSLGGQHIQEFFLGGYIITNMDYQKNSGRVHYNKYGL